MLINRYGIELKTLELEDALELRKWRNHEANRINMEFTEVISVKEQQHWFEQIDFTQNLLFIYRQANERQGFVQLKNIDWVNKTAEAGVIHGNAATSGTILPLMAIVSIMELAFGVLGLEQLNAKIKKGNKPVERLNKAIGYVMKRGEEDNLFRYYTANRAAFTLATRSFRSTLKKVATSDEFMLQLDKNSEVYDFWKDKIAENQEFSAMSTDPFKAIF